MIGNIYAVFSYLFDVADDSPFKAFVLYFI